MLSFALTYNISPTFIAFNVSIWEFESVSVSFMYMEDILLKVVIAPQWNSPAAGALIPVTVVTLYNNPPTSPWTREVPEDPDVPLVPDEPEVPEDPDVPLVPEDPLVPDEPEVPSPLSPVL